MKKFTFSIFLTSVLLISVPAFASVVTPSKTQAPRAVVTTVQTIDEKANVTLQNPAAKAPITTEKPAETKKFNIQVTPSANNFSCPMMQGNPGMMKMIPKTGIRYFNKAHPRMNMMYKFNPRPKVLGWIEIGIRFIAFLLFWILLIALLVVLIKWVLKPNHMMHCFKNHSSMDILKERYAKGEITSEQFEEMKAKLN